VPITCVRANASPSAIERSTCDSAAKVDDRVAASDELAHERAVLDRADDEVGVGAGEVLAPPGVGELVEHDELVLGAEEAHVGRADEAAAACHEQPHATALRAAR
jgi:hypothetical protein